MRIHNTIRSARSAGAVLAGVTVGLAALVGLAFHGQAAVVAPFALALPFATMALLDALVGRPPQHG